jgi:putative ABC transport system permease protein
MSAPGRITPLRRHLDTPLLRDLFDGIRAEPARVALSFMAVAIGIVALVLLLAVLGGLQEKSRLLVRELGANVFAVLPGAAGESGQKQSLEEKHAAILAQNLPGCTVSVIRRYELDTLGAGQKISIVAADESLAVVRGWGIRQGRFLDRVDIDQGNRNAVISASLAGLKRWKVGDVVSLEDTPFRIVGVLEPGTAAPEGGAGEKRLGVGEYVLFVPKTAPFPRRGERMEVSHRADAIFVQVPLDSDIHKALAIAQNLLRPPALGLDRISWVTPESLIQGVRRLQSSVRVAGGSVTFLCLVLGGTTLMSLMVANVRDRVVEIGLRRSLGATAVDVAKLFVLEACAVTFVASMAGMLVASAILLLVQNKSSMLVNIGALGMVMPLVLSIALGVMFSYWPARMAARISPSEALRNE